MQIQLQEIGDVGRHLDDAGAIERLHVAQHAHIFGSDKVDCHTFTTETTGATDTMDVVLEIARQIKVDDQRHLLHVDTARQQVGRDQHTRRTGTKLVQNHITI
jgi:hypothetical protein